MIDRRSEVGITFKTLTTLEQVVEAVDVCRQVGVCTFDLETGGLEYWNKKLPVTILAFAAQPGHVYCVPLQHPETYTAMTGITDPEDILTWRQDMERTWTSAVMNVFSSLLYDESVDKVAHNVKFDLHWLRRFIDLGRCAGRWYDTMLMSHLVDENRRHNLDDLTKTQVPHLAGYKLKLKTNEEWSNCPLDKLIPYAATDVHITMMLRLQFEPIMLEDPREYLYYRSLTAPVLWVLEEMEFNGCYIDRERVLESIEWAHQQEKSLLEELMAHPSLTLYEAKVRQLKDQEEIQRLVDLQSKHKEGGHHHTRYQVKIDALRSGQETVYEGLNLASPEQVADFVYSPIGLNLKERKGHGASTSRDVLKTYDNEWLELLAAWRQVTKMRSTYYEPILSYTDEEGYLHGSLQQTGTRTGRLSSSDPNLQNLPVRTPLKHPVAKEAVSRVKSFFTAPEGFRFMALDMSQAELRTIANVSGDPTMIEAYINGIDLHSLTASRIMGVSYEEFMALEKTDATTFKFYRTMAKGANFGLVYGIGPAGYIAYLADKYGVFIDDAQEKVHRAAFFKVYRRLKTWHDEYKAKLTKFKYVRTLFGRKRRLPDVDSRDRVLWAKALRNAINNPIQGTSAEYCFLAMALLKMRQPRSVRLFNNIHDALYCRVPEHLEAYQAELANVTFENLPLHLFDIAPERSPVKMTVDVEVGDSWLNLSKI